MKKMLKALRTKFYTFFCLRNVKHGKDCKCNFKCVFSSNTQMGNNCNFNGIRVSGNGRLSIGDNFHSGKNLRIITTFHNFDHGTAIPYDSTLYDRDVIIKDNVWIGENVMVLGGVIIGEGSIIQAGSVVCKNVPALAIAGGHPATTFKYRNRVHYETLKKQEAFF